MVDSHQMQKYLNESFTYKVNAKRWIIAVWMIYNAQCVCCESVYFTSIAASVQVKINTLN